MVTPNSLAVSNNAILGSSMSKTKGEYSTCTADIGWTACARRRALAEHSERPRYLTLPSLQKKCRQLAQKECHELHYLTNSAMARTVNCKRHASVYVYTGNVEWITSIGTVGSTLEECGLILVSYPVMTLRHSTCVDSISR